MYYIIYYYTLLSIYYKSFLISPNHINYYNKIKTPNNILYSLFIIFNTYY